MISTRISALDTRHRRPPSTPRSRRRVLSALAAVGAAALAISACSGTSSSGGAAGATHGHITLVVQSGDGGNTGMLAGYAALNKQFEAQHPGVTIKFQVKDFTNLVNTIKLELSGTNPPDVTQVNEGYDSGSMGPLVTDHLLLNLNSYASKYGWNTRQSASLLAIDGRFSSNGQTFGTGPLYGICSNGAWVGLFENTRIAHSLGITSAPTTLAMLEHDLAVAKAHHFVPMAFNAFGSSWMLASLLLASSPQLVTNIVTAKPGITLESAQVRTAANTIRTWGARGYFPAGWAANRTSDSIGQFLGGKSLFTVDGSWNVPLPSSVPAADFTMIPFPTAGGSAVATGDLDWSIPTNSKHQALAAEYINFLTSAQSAATWVAHGVVPATVPNNLNSLMNSSHLTGPSKSAMLGWQQIMTTGTPVPYMDWATPTFLNTIQTAVTELGAGKISPTAFAAALQADWGPFAKSRQ
jgi:raffinose/stachyose/melibiose transport system substrate-binding protein